MSRLAASLFAVVACVALLIASLPLAEARCPSNGNTRVLYMTSNMGDNIWSFDTSGNFLGEVINNESFPSDVKVDKLRAMQFGPGGHLYVTSARGTFSRIFAVSGNGLLNHTLQKNCTRNYLFTVAAQDKSNPLLDHPYDMAFHPTSDDIYVSNQNTATVTRYVLKKKATSTSPPEWEPAVNVKSALSAASDADTPIGGVIGANAGGDNADDSTEVGQYMNLKPADLPSNAGLFASSWSDDYQLSSVRGITMSPLLPRELVEGNGVPGLFPSNSSEMAYYLLVCDIAASVIHVFDPSSGARLFGINVPSPVQVSFPARSFHSEGDTGVEASKYYFEQPYIYTTSKEDGMAYLLRFTAHTATSGSRIQHGILDRTNQRGIYRITSPIPTHALSGLYEHEARDTLLIADRNGRRIMQYASPFTTDYEHGTGPAPELGAVVKNLPDQPEFLLSVVVENQRNLPFCHELAPNGNFRRAALCTATRLWTVVLAIILIAMPTLWIIGKIVSSRAKTAPASDAASKGDKESEPLLRAGAEASRGYGATDEL